MLVASASASACRCVGVAGVWGSVDLGPWGSWARGVLCGWAPAERIVSPIRALVPVVHRCSCCSAFAAAPLLVIQRAPRRVEVQPQYNTAHAWAFKVARTCPKMPAAGVLKAYCQGGLLPPPPPSCWVLHVRGPMGKLSLTRLAYVWCSEVC